MLAAGLTLDEIPYWREGTLDKYTPSGDYVVVKFARWAFEKFPAAEDKIGTQMRAVGEVLGMANSFGLAFYKAQEAAKQHLPLEGTVLITVSERDRPAVLEVTRQFNDLGFKIMATVGTHAFLGEQDIQSQHILKMHEGRPYIVDAIKNIEIQLVINTPSDKLSKYDDSYIRKAAIKHKVAYITTLTAVLAAAKGIAAKRKGRTTARSLQDYHQTIV